MRPLRFTKERLKKLTRFFNASAGIVSEQESLDTAKRTALIVGGLCAFAFMCSVCGLAFAIGSNGVSAGAAMKSSHPPFKNTTVIDDEMPELFGLVCEYQHDEVPEGCPDYHKLDDVDGQWGINSSMVDFTVETSGTALIIERPVLDGGRVVVCTEYANAIVCAAHAESVYVEGESFVPPSLQELVPADRPAKKDAKLLDRILS